MPNVSLSAVRDFTGVDGPELVTAVGALPLDRLDEMCAAVLDAGRGDQGGAPRASEVWPLVTIRASTFADGVSTGRPAGRPD